MKAFTKDGEEIDVYSADELKTHVDTEVEKVKGEFTPKLTAAETELGLAKKALGDRAGEFKQFRELHEDVLAKLSVTERALYENQLAQETDRKVRLEDEKKRAETNRDTALRNKAGTDDKLFDKMKDMWGVIGIEATTPEQIDNKVKMILGAISTTEPDLVASVAGFSGGSYKPPETIKTEKSFADTEKAKAGMAEIGLVIPVKEEKK